MGDPWAIVRVTPSTPEPEDDGWAVRTYTPRKGEAVVKPRPRTPGERYADNFEAGRRETLFGSAADAMAANIPGREAFERERNRDRAKAYEAISEADPWYEAPGGLPGKATAGLATLGGVLAGGMTSPEALIGAGRTVLGRIGVNAAVNAAADVPVQGLQNEAGTHEGFDPWRVVAAGATGAAMQGLGEAAIPAARGAGRALGRAADAAGPRVRSAADATGRAAAEVARKTGDAATAGWEVVKKTVAPPPRMRAPDEVSAIVREVLPEAQITSGYRTPAKNKRVGGAANSYHTRGGGQALDFVPPKGADPERFRAQLAGRGVRVVELLDEGDHWHLAWGADDAPSSLGQATPSEAPPAEQPAWLKDVPEQSLADVPDSDAPAIPEVDFTPNERPGSTARPTADARANATPEGGVGSGSRAAPGAQFADDAHARLYELGRKSLAGEVDAAEASALARDMGDLIDWTDFGLSKAELKALAEGRVSPERMVDAAKTFARQYDAPEGGGPHVSYYDPDRYGEALTRATQRAEQASAPKPLPPFPERLTDTPDKARLSGVERPQAVRDRMPTYGAEPPTVRPRQPLELDDPQTPPSDLDAADGAKRGMFVGRRAKTADRSSLARAEAMERGLGPAGAEKVRQDTGWFRGDDGEWRFEIADDRADYRTAPAKGFFGPRDVGLRRLGVMAEKGAGAYVPSRLDEIIDHPKLFAAYPDLRRVKVIVDRDGPPGSMSGDTLLLNPWKLRGTEDMRGVILHEIQHRIQRKEGFNLGASPTREGLELGGYAEALEARRRDLQAKGYKTERAAFETYHRSAGEVEARNTQTRKHMSELARRIVPPEATRDVPRSESLVVRNEPNLIERIQRWRAMSDEAAEFPDADDRRAAIDLSAYGDQIKGSRGGGSGNVVGARPSKAKAVGEGTPEYARQTVSQLAEKLRRSLGITQRQGRLTLKGGAVGEFDPRSGVIRTKAAKDAIDHLAHEAGHKLQHMRKPAVNAAIRAHAAELEKLAYQGANPRHRLEEGFAEFFKAYVLNPDEARLRAPNFYDRFEAALAKDVPVIARDLREIQKAYQDLLDAAALDVGAASVAMTGKPGPIREAIDALKRDGLDGVLLNIADEAYRGIWDQKHPFNVFMREVQKLAKKNTGARLQVEAADNPYVMARVADHAFSVAQSDLTNGVTPYKGTTPEGPSIVDINRQAFGKRQPSDEEFAQFGAYLISRRMRHEWDRFYRGELDNAPDKVEQDKAFHERLVEDAERLHPEWVKAAEMATEWNRAHWKLWYEAGFIGQATYEAGIKDHPDYVPLQRDMSDKNPPGGGGTRARGVGQFAGGVDAFVGSQRDVIHPLISMTRRAFEVRAAIARNDVVLTMWSAAEKAGENFGDLIEELPAKQFEKIKIDALQALDAVAEAIGMSERDRSAFHVFQSNELEGAIQAELFRQIEFSPRKDEAVVFAWKGGKKSPLLLPDGKLGRDLFTAISGMTKDTRTLWEEVAARSASALRLGVTGMPEFAIKTVMRDQLAAAILTDVGFIPYVDAARGGLNEAAKTAVAKRYQAIGGLKGGINVQATRRPFVRNDAEARQQIKHYQGRQLPVHSWRDVMHLADYGDTATRVGVYARAEAQALRRGLDPYKAAIEARHTAADFFDPSRHGAWPAVRQAARVIPFFNSGLQGPDVAARVLRHAFAKPETLSDKIKFRRAWWAAAKLAATAVLGGTLASMFWDDPAWQNINDQVRATHWPLMKLANGEWLLYPKSFELGMPSNLTERIFEWFHTRDPRVGERIGKDILNTSLPTRDAPILSVPFQAARNRSRMGQPIIPEHLKGRVEPQFEVNPWTSETAKLLAGNRVSPALLEHYLTGFLATGGRDALRVSDAAISAVRGEPRMKSRAPDTYITRGFVRRTARGSDAEENFWKVGGRDGELEKSANTLRLIVREGDDAKVAAYLGKLSPEARTYAIAKTLLGGKLGEAHPIARARSAMGVIGAMRRENREGTLVGADNRLIRLTPAQRRGVDDALDDLALVEAHNAQVAAGIKGWAQRDFMERRAPIDRLNKIAPPVAQALNARMAQEGVLPIRSAAALWRSASETAEGLSDAQLRAFATRARMNTGQERRAEVRRLGAAKATERQPINIFQRRPAEPREPANVFAR